MIEARYVLGIDEATDAAREMYRRHWPTRLGRVASILVGVGLIGLVFTGKPSPAYWTMAVGIWFVWHGIRSPVRRFGFKQHLQESVTNEEVVVQIDDSVVITASPTTRTEVKWAAFKLQLESSKTFVLYDGMLLYVFPKRAFNEQSRQEFRRLVAGKNIPTNLQFVLIGGIRRSKGPLEF